MALSKNKGELSTVIDQRFYKKKSSYSIAAISESLECELVQPSSGAGDPKGIIISDIAPIESATLSDLTFFSNPKYEKAFRSTKAGLCIVAKHYNGQVPENTWLLKSDNPYYTYALAIDLFYEPLAGESIYSISLGRSEAQIRGSQETKKDVDNLHETLGSSPREVSLDPSVKIGKNCKIGLYCVIAAGVEIGDNAQIGAGCFIGYGVKIGNNARIDAGVSISYSIIGDDVVILPGARIGQDGFGFATKAGRHRKIFHIGRVLIGNDVEIGANTTIDRGSMQDTVIGDGVRIDNLVQIGHNVHIGKGSIIVSQVGIAGSSKIGNYCALGGQVGVSGHITIADQVQIVAQSGLLKDVEEVGSVVAGTPAVPVKDWHRQTIFLKKAIGKKT